MRFLEARTARTSTRGKDRAVRLMSMLRPLIDGRPASMRANTAYPIKFLNRISETDNRKISQQCCIDVHPLSLEKRECPYLTIYSVALIQIGDQKHAGFKQLDSTRQLSNLRAKQHPQSTSDQVLQEKCLFVELRGHLRALNSDGGRATALVSLGSQDLVVMAAQLQTILGPRIKVRLHIDRTTNPLLLPDTPELGERAGTLDGRLVVSGRLENVVGAAIGRDGTLLLCCRRGVVAAVRLDDVVLDEGVPGPTVQRDVAVDGSSIPGAGVGDGAACSGIPALSSDEVVDVVPADRVLATSLYCVMFDSIEIL